MVDAAGVSAVEEEGEEEDLQSLIAGRGFNNGGGVRGFAGPDGSVVENSTNIPLAEDDPLYIHTDSPWAGLPDHYRINPVTGEPRTEEEIYEMIRMHKFSLPLAPQSITGENIPGVQEAADRALEAANIRRNDPDFLSQEELIGIIAEEGTARENYATAEATATKGNVNRRREALGLDTLEELNVPPTPVTVPEPVVAVEEDTRIKPDWNMLREWGAGGMGATTTADALGGSGRAVGVEIARQEKAALEGRILTAKEAQMEIDKEVALAINNRQLNVDAQERLMEYRENTVFYYAAIAEQASQQTGNIYTAEDVGESMSGKSPDAAITAAVRAVDRQFLRQMGVGGGLGAAEPISDEGVVAAATALNEGS
jgi:hypothetical protein